MKKILVLCTGNSCRSQMAEGYLKKYANGSAEIYSAGIETHGVSPKAVAVMKEDGVDISRNTSNNVSEYRDINFDYVITVCDNAKEQCPVFPSSAKKIHHNFPDPAKARGTEEEVMQQFRAVRDEIKKFSREFISGVSTNSVSTSSVSTNSVSTSSVSTSSVSTSSVSTSSVSTSST